MPLDDVAPVPVEGVGASRQAVSPMTARWLEWIALEDAFFAADGPRACATFIVAGDAEAESGAVVHERTEAVR